MADEFKIVASLNIPESASRINKDIPKLEGQAKHLKIVADLNPTLSIKNIQATLNKMNNNANIKIGVDTSGLNSVQGATQNITNNLKTVQTQAQQTASAVREVTTSMSANDISNKMVSEFQKSFNIVGENAKNTQQTFKALFAELNNAWYSENEEKYLKVLEQIYDIAQKTTKVVKQSKSEINASIDQIRSELTDGSKAFISPQVRKELEYLLGTSKQIQSVLSTVYGVGKWSFNKGRATDILANGDKGVLGQADEIVEAYNKIQSIKSSSEYTILDSFDRDRESIDSCMRSVLNLSNAYRDLNGVEHTYIQGLGWFEEVASENEKVTASLNTVQKEAKETAIALGEIGHNFISNNKVQATFSSIKQAEEYFKSLNLGDVSLSLNKGSLQGLTDFTVKIKSATGEVERFRYAVNNVGDDQNPILEYNLTNINASNEAVQRLINSYQKAQDKVKALRTNLTAELKSIRNAWEDVNGGKSVKSDENIERLKQQYIKVTQAIRELRNADDTTLASMKANADAQIDKLNQMVTQYHNAEKVATQLRAKGFETVKIDTGNNIDKFINSINNSKVPIQAMQTEINKLTSDFAQLDTIQDQAGKSAALTNILNTLDNAKTKFQSLKVMYQSIGNYDKQLDKLAQDWQKQGIYVGNVKTTIESLKASLANVTTANGLTNWVNDFKTQIGAINEMPIKVMECKQKIAETSKEWYKQGILVKDVAQEMSAFKQSLSLVSSSGEMEQWNKNWDSFIQRVVQAKGNLDKQVESYNNIYSIQAKIAKLNPTKDTAEITRLNEKLKLEQDSLSKLQQQSNVYATLISQEQQEKYITEQTAQARDKLLSATNTGAKQYQTTITNAITELQGIANSAVFGKNASNPQVTQTKQDINSLITAYQNLATKLQSNITPAGLETVRTKLTQLNARFNDATTTAKRFETELRSDNSAEQLAQKVALLTQRIKAYRQANSKSEKMFGSKYDSMLSQLANPNIDLNAYNALNKQFQRMRQEINAANVAGKNLWQTFKEKLAKFTGWMSMTAAVSTFTRSIRDALDELKEVDTILTEISKTSDRTEESLRKLGETSFATASKYGQKASDYLLGVQEMSRAGFDENSSEQMAELSTLAQSAGDMTAELANEYLIATNAGYQFGGSVEKLNSVLDSQNYITNHNALSMSELAEATKIVASQAAQSGIGIDEMTAAVGTMIATTQQGGEVAARALKGILMNLQAVKGTAEDIGDGGEDITDESLTKYEKACVDLGVALKEVKNGVLQLRDPMVILEELANAVSKEAEGSIKVANLVSAIGGKYRGGQLLSLLRNWDTYSKMLSEFNSNEAVSSAFGEAMKSAESWEGKLNELSNTWTDFVNGLVTSDTVKSVIDFLTTIIKNIDKLRDSIGTLPTLLGSIATVGAVKNVGELLNTPVYAQPQFICA